LVLQDYEEYYQFAQMVEKMFDFHQNSYDDNMVVVEVAHKTIDISHMLRLLKVRLTLLQRLFILLII